jgi:hypothetical protein
MTAKFESKLNMYRSVLALCDDNNAIISINREFLNNIANLRSIVTAIISTASLEGQINTGIAIDKKEGKKELCKNGADIASIVYAYASTIGNNTLKQSVNYSYSNLLKLRDDLLCPIIRNIYNVADTNKTELEAYGITGSILTTLQLLTDTYSNAVPKPTTAKAIKRTYTSNLKQLEKDADDILKNRMDKLITTFKKANPDFVSNYKNVRLIIDPGTASTQIRGTVTGKQTKEPLGGVQININDGIRSATTDSKGKYILKTLKNGVYSITVSKTGYQIRIISDISVKLGQATTVDIVLETVV